MRPLFNINLPAPSSQAIDHYRRYVGHLKRGSLIAAGVCGGGTVYGILSCVLSGAFIHGAGAFLVCSAGALAFTWLLKCFNEYSEECRQLTPAHLPWPQVEDTFGMTTESRRYASEVAKHNRPMVLGELEMYQAFARELDQLMRALPDEKIVELAKKIGLRIDVRA